MLDATRLPRRQSTCRAARMQGSRVRDAPWACKGQQSGLVQLQGVLMHRARAGVSDNRVQNVAITLDKARLVLQQPGQSQQAPLRLCSDDEVAEHLWSGAAPTCMCTSSASRQLPGRLCGVCQAAATGGATVSQGCDGSSLSAAASCEVADQPVALSSSTSAAPRAVKSPAAAGRLQLPNPHSQAQALSAKSRLSWSHACSRSAGACCEQRRSTEQPHSVSFLHWQHLCGQARAVGSSRRLAGSGR